MPLPPTFLDELRARLPISQVVAARMRLTRAGREHKGLCPFHKEKSPSFTVNDQKGFFHCFGCGAHGDVVGFVMQHDRLAFMEAVELLAGEAGLPVPKASPEDAARFARAKGLHDVVEAAARFFEQELAGPSGRDARAYLDRRGLDAETIARFRLGWAPPDGRALMKALEERGLGRDGMVEAGLLRQPEEAGATPYAFFRSRVMFPVADRRGRIVAFGGRILEGDGPKYVNSPDTPLFHKGRLLYGLSRARMAAGEGHEVIVAEGYMDVIALVRAGFAGAVAPLGTALTEEQIAELWGAARVPVLCFDGDEAGRRAAWRATDRILPLLRPDHSARVAFLPPGEDPDSLIRREGAPAMRAILAAAASLADVVWSQEAARPTDTPEGRAGLKASLEAQARRIAERSVQDFYLREFRQRLEDAFPWRPRRDRRQPGRPGVPATGLGPRPQRPRGRRPEAEAGAILLAILVNHPALFDELGEEIGLAVMPDGAHDRLRQGVVGALAEDGGLDPEALRRYLCQVGEGESLDRLLSDALFTRAPFARAGASEEQVRAGWEGIRRNVLRQHLRADLRDAGEALARDPTDENMARLRALQAQVAEGDGGDATGVS